MAATDQTYRNQKVLDILFACSATLMLLSILWMFADDYNREYKAEQRRFRDVLVAMAQRQALSQLPSRAEFLEALARVKARKIKAAEIPQELQRVQEQIQELQAELKGTKDTKQRTALERRLQQAQYYQKLLQEEKPRAEERDRKVPELRQKVAELKPQREKAEARYQNLKAELDSLRSFYDLACERYGADSPVAQDYKKRVLEYEQRVQEALAHSQEITDKLKHYQAEADALEQPLLQAQSQLNKLTEKFDTQVKLAIQKQWGLGDWVRNLPILDAFAAPVKIQQITLTDLPIDYNFKYVTRFDRCITCHQGIDKPSYSKERLRELGQLPAELEQKLEEAQDLLAARREALAGLPELRNLPTPKELRLSSVPLSEAQVREFCAHPRLDLFVASNSKHPVERFGCTICHSGQGSATTFNLASHTPNTPAQREQWEQVHQWEVNHYWDFPMLPLRFVESSCLQCHHQVTDLITSDNRNTAPKLIRGYRILLDLGCFGCHEISGRKNGREVGPDLRLEPTPPLESLTPAERLKLLADPDNAPGNLRKVGPSLYRLAEKTNPAWAVKWLRAPRQFRPDTKMPHFYGLSNNHPSQLSDEFPGGQSQLPPEQRLFPDAEIHAIIYYLFQASQDYLSGKARRQDEQRVQELTARAAKGELSSDEQKLLAEAQERLRQKPPEPLDPAPAKGDPVRGRQLFSERGCLACHHHRATDEPGDGLPALPSEAQFGPDLSQLPAKLGEGKGKDDPQAFRWLVNWLQHPQRHSPRTRMPVTHLTNQEAADIAAWLLSQPPQDLGPEWAQLQVPEPSLDTLKQLARVYLIRNLAPHEVDQFFTGELVERDEHGQIRRDDRGAVLGPLNKLPLEDQELGLQIAQAGGKVDAQQLTWYLGKKAIGRLGCFGCHDIPGFDHAKPIGVNLQDWGRKDPSRLAFEDSDHFIEDNFYLVDQDSSSGAAAKPRSENGRRKLPYERYFAEALFQRQREGYLSLKLREPRSYDYHRLRAWDDLSRMPQFQFARLRRRKGESDQDFEARRLQAEDEAREAVMTFILGLVAEPIPLAYLHQPSGDRLAEVKGLQILEQFNCAGCHLLRPGVYEFQLTPKSRQLLRKAYDGAKGSYTADYALHQHHYWSGQTPPANADRLQASGVKPILTRLGREKVLFLTLTEALRFPDAEGDIRDSKGNRYFDIRASSQLVLRPEDLLYPAPEQVQAEQRRAAKARAEYWLADFSPQAGEYGGVFARLLGEYLMEKNPKDYTRPDEYPLQENNAVRASVPPPLLGEGERTQPDWLFQFLLEPQPVRKMTVLRMPRFSLSEEEAQALVAYFAAVEHLRNPHTELPFPQVRIVQQSGLDSSYWQDKTAAYVARLKATKVKGPDGKERSLYEQRRQELGPVWEQLHQEVQGQVRFAEQQVQKAQARLTAAKSALAQAPAAQRKTAEEAVAEAERLVGVWQDELAQARQRLQQSEPAQLEALWASRQAYLNDAFRLLTDRNLCSKCHQIGSLGVTEGKTQGPPLALAARRLRPDWIAHWVANPQRHLPYNSVMPQYFPADDPAKFQELFAVAPLEPGAAWQRIEAIRDVLMVFEQAQALPVNQHLIRPTLSAATDASEGRPSRPPGDTKK